MKVGNFSYFKTLRARWRLAIIALAVVVLGTVAICLASPTLYSATASVVVDFSRNDMSNAEQTALVQASSSYLLTQIDIIGSERVARRVVEMLQLDQDPSTRAKWLSSTHGKGDYLSWIAGAVQRRVYILPAQDSNVINILAKWPSADGAAAVANAYAKAYIDTTLALKVDPAKQYSTWFEQRLQELRSQLEDKQKLLTEYRSEYQITGTDERMDVDSVRLTELSSEVTRAEAARVASQSRIERLGNGRESLPEVLQNSTVGNLKEELARAEARQKEAALNLGVNHPDYQRAVTEVAALKSQIASETDKVLASMRRDVQSSTARETEAREALDRQKAHVLELNEQREKMNLLSADVERAQKNLEAVSQSMEKTNLESKLQQTNVIPLTPATAPGRPSSPNYTVAIGLSVVIGMIFAATLVFIVEAIRPRIRSDEDLALLLSVPLLGRVGTLVPSKGRSHMLSSSRTLLGRERARLAAP